MSIKGISNKSFDQNFCEGLRVNKAVKGCFTSESEGEFLNRANS